MVALLKQSSVVRCPTEFVGKSLKPLYGENANTRGVGGFVFNREITRSASLVCHPRPRVGSAGEDVFSVTKDEKSTE